MKKICYIVTLPLTIKAFFIPQLKHLSKNGFEVSVICNSDSDLGNELGNEVKFIPVDIPRGISFIDSIKTIKKLIKIFKTEKFDLVQYSTPNAALYSAIASKFVKIKIRNYHCMGFRYLGFHGIARIIFKLIEKITCSLSTHIECVSKSNLELGISEKLFSEDKATVVFNGSTGGVDLEKFDFSKRQQWRMEIRKKLGYSNSDFIYGFVGRITKDKGIDELLSAFLELKDSSKLLLVGSLEEDNRLNTMLLANAKVHPNVQFYEFVSDIERYYAAIDVLVLPSYREGFGNVVIEASAVGTPAIVTDIPGPTDTIDREKTALVVPVENSKALVESLKKIQASDYVGMGKNAAQFVKEKFDSKILCEKILERKETLLGLQ